jgi:predicted PhzF superfamily epimerase YddE/YHI9
MSVIQGAKMGRISHMQANAICKNGSLISVGVSGPAAVTATGKIEVSKEWLDTP